MNSIELINGAPTLAQTVRLLSRAAGLLLACGLTAALAQTRSQVMVGADAWSLHPSVEQDTLPAQGVQDNTWLMLPNAATQHTFQPLSPWLRWQAEAEWDAHVSGSVKFRADQNFAAVFDELALTWQPTLALGARVGVLDYKTTWCRTYDVDSPWMREPDSFCSFSHIKDGVAGAPGVQVISQHRTQQHVLSAVVGAYDPMVFRYDKDEFSNFFTSPTMQVTHNQKAGVSLSWLNTLNANELRLSWLHSDQAAKDPMVTGPVEQSADLLYIGATQHWGRRHQTRYVFTRFFADRHFTLAANAVRGPVEVLSVPERRDSHAWEWLYRWDERDQLALGASAFTMRASDTFSTNGQTVERDPFFRLNHWGVYAGWRRDISKDMFLAAQVMQVKQSHEYFDSRPSSRSKGHAWGMRWGYRY
jgi:hypothetical protein